ncbi:MAG: hypothetical protein AB4042_06770 [Leptolyngbyaceae cyanobacterium]
MGIESRESISCEELENFDLFYLLYSTEIYLVYKFLLILAVLYSGLAKVSTAKAANNTSNLLRPKAKIDWEWVGWFVDEAIAYH